MLYPKVYSWDKQDSFPIEVAKIFRGTPALHSGVSETTEANKN